VRNSVSKVPNSGAEISNDHSTGAYEEEENSVGWGKFGGVKQDQADGPGGRGGGSRGEKAYQQGMSIGCIMGLWGKARRAKK